MAQNDEDAYRILGIEATASVSYSAIGGIGLHVFTIAPMIVSSSVQNAPDSWGHAAVLGHELALRHRVSEKSVWSRGLLCVKREGMVAISSMGKLAAEAMSEAEKETVGDILTKIITQPAQVEPAEPELRAQLLSSQADQFKPTLSTAVDIDGT